MTRPRSRRALLASVATSAAVATGGFESPSNEMNAPSLESGTVPTDWYECSDVTRPEPDASDDEDTIEPREYPSLPLSLRDGAAQYATDFERAYRQNAFLVRYGSTTRTFELRRNDQRTETVGSTEKTNAVLVAIVYDLATGTRHAPQSDEWDTRVTYYVGENIVLRAKYDGIARKPTFEPDPRVHGDLVACFE